MVLYWLMKGITNGVMIPTTSLCGLAGPALSYGAPGESPSIPDISYRELVYFGVPVPSPTLYISFSRIGRSGTGCSTKSYSGPSSEGARKYMKSRIQKAVGLEDIDSIG
ncbi:hypothetical protein QC762_0098220 [Podospora pseudocomata]|uniref:Uncharacterized protein n=1 Tax=Podospora pseudocomata TaxID=2093779 RepID=A0ABR0G893_9PEZI|nr:hypothetical protein QC762_0098220 [Podospora pseudocomata]